MQEEAFMVGFLFKYVKSQGSNNPTIQLIQDWGDLQQERCQLSPTCHDNTNDMIHVVVLSISMCWWFSFACVLRQVRLCLRAGQRQGHNNPKVQAWCNVQQECCHDSCCFVNFHCADFFMCMFTSTVPWSWTETRTLQSDTTVTTRRQCATSTLPWFVLLFCRFSMQIIPSQRNFHQGLVCWNLWTGAVSGGLVSVMDWKSLMFHCRGLAYLPGWSQLAKSMLIVPT
jgi:hypothetical protein